MRYVNLKSLLGDALKKMKLMKMIFKAWRSTYCQSECLILVWQTVQKREKEKRRGKSFEVKRVSESWWGSGQAANRASAQVLGR